MTTKRIIYVLLWVCGFASSACAQSLQLETITAYPFPSELNSAASGSKIAVAINEQGKRNLYVAEGPAFKLRKLTAYHADTGDEITGVSISPDGERVVYVKGGDHGAYSGSTPRNPASLPYMPKVQVWSIPFAGGEPVLLADGDNPTITPAGDRVIFERQGQLWEVPIDGSAQAKQLFYARGSISAPQWSPDGSMLAFVSSREDHALIGVYRDQDTPIQWLAPSFSRDGSPRWSPEGNSIAFVRREASGGAPDSLVARKINPWSVWTVQINDGTARQVWESPATVEGSPSTTHGGTNLHWAAKDRIVFLSYHDKWPHLYAVPDTGGEAMLLTPGDFMAEHIRLSPDKNWVIFSANTGPDADDIDRRHIARVPVDKAKMEVLTPGTGIETSPVLTGDGQYLAFISATAKQPSLPAILPWSEARANPRLLGENLIPEALRKAPQVVPKRVEFKAADGMTVYGQLFEPEGNTATKKPAILFIHGGPQRQMLLGWHYGDYYANTYALNQYLVSRGFIVLSVNYRLGIGYGYDFHKPKFAGAFGASEYLDVKASGEWLAALPQVDTSRIGIYGGSYGGFLTALALGKDSDLFAAGVDIHGVHNFIGRVSPVSTEPAPDLELALKLVRESSPVSYVDTWTSPVLLIHGDDDANVDFHQSVDLIKRLKAHNVPHETLMIPDETHHWMLYKNQVKVGKAVADFFERKFLKQQQ